MVSKVIFWIDGNPFTYVLANSLQEKINSEFFAIIDITDRPKKFFQQQKFVDFKKTWFFHDHISNDSKPIDYEFLKSFEKKYNINLWTLAQNERLFNHYNKYHVFTTDEILSILQDECKLYDAILEEVKPDFFVTKETALHHHHLFYKMCRALGVKVLMLNQSKFGYHCLITEELHQLDNVQNLDEIKFENRSFEELRNYLKSFDMQKQLIDHKNTFLTSKKGKIKAAIQLLLLSNNSNIKNNFAYKGRTKLRVLCKEITYSIKTKRNQSFLDSHSVYGIPPLTNFVYFPLHQDPERVLLIGSPFYTNQLETIRNIAKSLPIDYKLFVKEHPTQSIRGWHEINFYKSIIQMPNVILLHHSVSNDEIFKKCNLVITVNGTAGLEAAFYEKPSIIFSPLGYSILSSVFLLDAITSLPELIRKALLTKVDLVQLNKYVNLIKENSFEFDLFQFISDYQAYFYYGGHLADIEIQIAKMEKFLNDKKFIFDQLSEHYIKKIQEHTN